MIYRQKLGLRGPVWKVVEEWQSPYESIAESVFDSDGMLIVPPQPHLDVRKGDDGSRLELRRIAGADSWSMDGLNGVCFFLRGATLAETTFTSQGMPSLTAFKSANGDVVSRISYICDERGRVLEAHQHGLETFPLPPGMATWPQPVIDATLHAVRDYTGPKAGVRVTFVYDEDDRVVEQSNYFGEQLNLRTACTYNEHGDKLTFLSTGEEPYTFEYEYDGWGNWIRQVVHHPAGSAEGRRRITYYQ